MHRIEGQVLWGSNSIYYVQCPRIGDGSVIECRFRGKKLRTQELEYNPLAPGDFVSIESDLSETELFRQSRPTAQIVERHERQNKIERWNRKRNAAQVLLANLDLLVVVASVQSPPFRPRFVDRCLVACESQSVPVLVLINKIDLGIEENDADRILNYRKLGYDVLLSSTTLGEGLEELKSRCAGKLVAFFGQSGAGKSTLLRALDGSIETAVGAVNAKFNRGKHTTTLARTWPVSFARGIADTPGIRQLELMHENPRGISACFRDIAPFETACARYNCTHREEPDCAVVSAVERGDILFDRYDSYRRIVDGLAD